MCFIDRYFYGKQNICLKLKFLGPFKLMTRNKKYKTFLSFFIVSFSRNSEYDAHRRQEKVSEGVLFSKYQYWNYKVTVVKNIFFSHKYITKRTRLTL